MKQATLDGELLDLNQVGCEVYGGLCGEEAEYRIQLSGNEYCDGGDPLLACETCKDELETHADWVEELTEQEVLG